MKALFIIRRDDEVGLDYLNKICEKIMSNQLGIFSVEAKVDEGVHYFEFTIEVSNQNLLLL